MDSGGDKDKGEKKKQPKNLTDPSESDGHEIDSTISTIRANLPPEEEKQSNAEQNPKQDLGAISKALKVDLPEEGKSKRRNRGTDPKVLKLDLSKGKSKGRTRGQNLDVRPKMSASQSWAQASTSKSGDKQHYSPPRTRSQSKSPGRTWFGKAMSYRPKSVSPMKPYHKPWKKDDQSSDTEPLLDHPDGISRPVPSKKKETKPAKVKFENKHIKMNDPYISDEERSQTSTISSQSSSGVVKATGKLNMGDSSEADEMEDEAERKGSSESASSRGKKKRPGAGSKDKSKK